MEDKGKLLVSTKTGTGRKAVQYIVCAAMFILGIYLFINFDPFREIGIELFGNSTVGVVMGIICIVVLLMCPVIVILNHRSYCDVYEHAVVGATKIDYKKISGDTIKKFEITYGDILNVTESKNTLLIHTSYTTYEVSAMKNQNEALNEIRRRMTGKK